MVVGMVKVPTRTAAAQTPHNDLRASTNTINHTARSRGTISPATPTGGTQWAVRKLAPAALAAFHASGGATRGGGLEMPPNDFSTGSEAMDAGSKVLRLLYIDDLRKLQTAVNNVIVKAQAFTANPKTDAKLGKVGYWPAIRIRYM